MSRTTTGQYRCDNCKANLTLKETTPVHISLEIGSRSGLASDSGPLQGWRIVDGLPAGQYNFCFNTTCASEFFMKLFSERALHLDA